MEEREEREECVCAKCGERMETKGDGDGKGEEKEKEKKDEGDEG